MITFPTFSEWADLHEAARRSFARNMGKFLPQQSRRPVAILTAWRGELLDAAGRPHPQKMQRKLNDEANRKMMANVRRRGLSFVSVVGDGQEEGEDGVLTANRENSFLIQPVGEMSEREFLDHIKGLLYNPAGEPGRGPFPHSQWGGLVKLPSEPKAFIVHQQGDPTGPEEYRIGDYLGTNARPRKGEPYYTQLKYGPRASDSMMDSLDKPNDLGNIMGRPGRRFTLERLMSDDLEKKTDADRLQEFKAELSRHFGKLTQWRVLCQERDVTNVEGQIRLAEDVLKAPSTGTNAEWLTHHLRLQGGKSFDVDEMLAGGGSSSRNEAT